jgi:hypothetical protein
MTMAVRSTGVWLDDDLCHYQIARLAWRYPKMLINTWGRPGCTIPYSAVANIGTMATGFTAARLLTSAMAVLAIWLTWKTAIKMRAPLANLVPLVLLLTPEFFGESYTPCTEIPAALYTIAGTYLLASGRHRWGAMCFALLPATRHELAPFLVPLGLWFLWRRDLLAAFLLGWFEGVWAGVSWWTGESQPIYRYFTAQDATQYGSGSFSHYFLLWFKMAGPVGVGLCLAGAWMIVAHEYRAKRWNWKNAAGRRSRLRLLAVGGMVGLIALETVLYAFNRFASGGYSTFLVPAAPLMALCACYGVSAMAHFLKPTVIIGFGLIAMVHVCLIAHPYLLSPHQLLVQSAIARLEHDDPHCHIVGDSPWIVYFDEVCPGARELNAQGTWALGKALPLYYICDNNDEAAERIKVSLGTYPCEMVRRIKIRDTDLITDLIIYRRLPDKTK